MKGSGLREDRKKARRAGQRRETSDLNSKQGNQVEEGGRKEEASSCVHDLKAMVEEAFLTGAHCENSYPIYARAHTPIQTNDKCSSIILLLRTLIDDI